MGATPISSYRRCDESVRQKETVRTTEVIPPANPTPSVSTVAMPRWDPVDIIHKKGAKEFQGNKEDDLIVVEN